MDNYELEKKIRTLEKELENYKTREEYTKIGLERTKNVYEIARKNAEIIIAKSISLGQEFKKDIEEVILNIEANPIEFTKYLKEFLDKNDHFLNKKDESIEKYLDEIINTLKK
ncbi:hypothetical protein [Spiroplasma endosymbiont of Atherix ibis]|uniref:hypothetical protein n=1 Tax=Spiroplasma endosymbiont of Atherix ibis TaxID=3066291 RepID=UPI0030D055D2